MSTAGSIAARYHEAFNSRDLDGCGALLDDDVELRMESAVLRGRHAVLEHMSGILAAFPGVLVVPQDVVAETADAVVTELRIVNPVRAPAEPGAPPAPQWQLRGLACEVLRVRGDRIAAIHTWYASDEADRTDAGQVPSRREAMRIAEEQAALRRVATLVARGVSRDEVFAAVNEEIARIVGADTTSLMRFGADETVTLLAAWSATGIRFPVGGRRPVDRALREVRDLGRPLRFGPAELPAEGPFVEESKAVGVRSAIGVPITVGGRVWGVTFAASTGSEPFPGDTEERMARFAELVATALANAQAREELEQLAGQQAALRRVAELAAGGAPEAQVLEAVVREAAGLLGVGVTALLRYDPDGSAELVATHGAPDGLAVGARGDAVGDGVVDGVRRTGGAVRVDGYEGVEGFWPQTARDLGLTSGVGVPIAVEGRLWGLLLAMARDEPLPHGIEERLGRYADLVGTAISGAQARSQLRGLAEEQAGLRRVAELIARAVPQQEVLVAAAAESSAIAGGAGTAIMRYEPDGAGTVVAVCRSPAPLGLRVPAGAGTATAEVLRTGRPSRTETFEGTPIAGMARRYGVAGGLAVPIAVEGRVWGNLSMSTPDRLPPPGIEERLAKFADLVAAAIAGTQARTALRGLADEQAALRRVAELVARGVGQDELFATVAVEASRLMDDEAATLLRFDDDAGAGTVVASCRGPAPVGTRTLVTADDEGILTEILRTGRPARLDDYAAVTGRAFARDDFGVGASVAVPIFVEDRMWGALGISSPERGLPVGAERRLQQFADLIAAALANAQARGQVQQLADEQAALRRVAELVARGVAPEEVFGAVAQEASRLLGDVPMSLMRYDGPYEVRVLAASSGPVPPGTLIAFEPDAHADRVRRTGRAVRVDDLSTDPGAPPAASYGVAAAVAVPITVEGRSWGLLTATSPEQPLPRGTEHRLKQFADLVAAAVSNADHRAQLTASRARVVAAADESRRRVQRDVHDGAQQRLVQAVITLKLARERLGEGPAAELVDESLLHVERATAELRDLVRGILPASLSRGGLRTGIESLVADLALPVEVEVAVPRLPPEVETTAYFVVAEALTNVVKHAEASRAHVRATLAGEGLRVEVRDDGVGGAGPVGGSGLTGLFDRVEAGEGALTITSPPGQGTTVVAALPLRPAGGDAQAPGPRAAPRELRSDHAGT